MRLEVRPYCDDDIAAMMEVWNEVVEAGDAFPQTEPLTEQTAREFFGEQTCTGVASAQGRIVGLYIVHPNNVGRCAHVANASYAVSSHVRGMGVGRALVTDSLERAARAGFRGMQFNAVVVGNEFAIHLYENMGFTRVGTIPGGFHNASGVYEDMFIYYRSCVD